MAIMLTLVVRRVWKNAKVVYKNMRASKELKKMRSLIELSSRIDEEYKCVICCELVKHVIFKPCLHMACCSVCFEKMEGRECIICKREIEDVIKIYVK